MLPERNREGMRATPPPGGGEREDRRVNVVKVLEQVETACVDSDRLDALYRNLGPAAAEDLVCRAVEELAIAITYAGDLYAEGRTDRLRETMVEVGNIAEQIGLTGLSLVAGHVADTIDQGDAAALAATLDRLIRVGERSLTAVWDAETLPI